MISNKFFNFLGYFLVFIVCFGFFLTIQTAGQTLNCPDSFYHAKIASFLAEGKLIKDFPWLPYTILAKNYSDHHFLYHLLLVPFVKVFNNPLSAIKMATLFFATLAIVLFYWLLRKFKIKFPLFWTFLLLTSSTFLTRLNLAKVPAAALPVLILGLYALFKRKYFLLGLISLIYVWLYNTWPILLITVVLYCLANVIKKFIDQPISIPEKIKNQKSKIKNIFLYFIFYISYLIRYFFRKDNLKLLSVCLLGIITGLVINPYFPQNLYFNWVHIVKIGLKNYQDILSVGVEWHPYEPLDLIFGNLFIFVPWLISLGWFFVSFKRAALPFSGQGVKPLTLFILSFLFFFYTIKSRRNIEYFVPLAILFTSFSLNHLFLKFPWKNYFEELKKIRVFPYNLVTVLLLCFVLTIFLFSGLTLFERVWQAKVKEFAGGASFDRLKGVSLFLKENTQKGEMVFHSSWDEFPMLFYHQEQNYYIAGLDPTFFYEESKPLYWLWFNIITGRQKENLAQTIKENFRAKYVFVREDRETMKNNFEGNKNFEKIYEDREGNLYKIKNEK